MYRSTKAIMASQHAPNNEFAIENLQFSIYEDKKRGMEPKYTIGKFGESERWNAEGNFPACRVMWAELHGKGNAGGQFAPAPGLEEYTLKLDMGNDFKEIFPKNMEKCDRLSARVTAFKENLLALSDAYVSWVFENPIGALVKFRQDCLSNARKSVARTRGVKQSEFTEADKANVVADSLERFKTNFNIIVRTDKNGVPFIQPKSRVMQYRDKSPEPVLTKVPILDVGDTSICLNAMDNEEKHVDWGTIVGGRIRLRPYVIASGKFGIKLQLLEVTKIMDRSTGGPRKKRRLDYSDVLE